MAKYYLEIRRTWNHSGKQKGRNQIILVDTNKGEPQVGEKYRNPLFTETVVRVQEVK